MAGLVLHVLPVGVTSLQTGRIPLPNYVAERATTVWTRERNVAVDLWWRGSLLYKGEWRFPLKCRLPASFRVSRVIKLTKSIGNYTNRATNKFDILLWTFCDPDYSLLIAIIGHCCDVIFLTSVHASDTPSVGVGRIGAVFTKHPPYLHWSTQPTTKLPMDH